MTTRKKQWNNIVLLYFLLSLISMDLGATNEGQSTIFDVLNYAEVVKVDLSYDMTAVNENRRDSKDYPGTLNLVDIHAHPEN